MAAVAVAAKSVLFLYSRTGLSGTVVKIPGALHQKLVACSSPAAIAPAACCTPASAIFRMRVVVVKAGAVP